MCPKSLCHCPNRPRKPPIIFHFLSLFVFISIQDIGWSILEQKNKPTSNECKRLQSEYS